MGAIAALSRIAPNEVLAHRPLALGEVGVAGVELALGLEHVEKIDETAPVTAMGKPDRPLLHLLGLR